MTGDSHLHVYGDSVVFILIYIFNVNMKMLLYGIVVMITQKEKET